MKILSLKERMEVVEYFNSNRSTLRETGKHFGISYNTVYLILTKQFPNFVSREILDTNKAERHFRGGEANKNKYLSKRSS